MADDGVDDVGTNLPVAEPAGPSVGGIVLLALACLPYLMLIGTLPAADDFPGEGGGEARIAESFQEVFAYTACGAILVLLALAFWRATRTGVFAGWARQTLPIVVLGAGVAMIFAMGQAFEQPGPLSILVPESLPPVMAVYALWGCQPALSRWLFRRHQTGKIDAAAIGLIAALALAAVPLCILDAESWPGRLDRHHAEQAAADAAARAAGEQQERELRAKFARLGPDSSLRDYIEARGWYLTGVDIVGGARQVKTRQTDAVAMLNEGMIVDLSDLWRLDLQPSPALCDVYGHALAATFGQQETWRGSAYLSLIETQFPNMHWLRESGCDLDRAVAEIDRQLGWMLDSKDPSGAAADDYAAYYSRFGVSRETVAAMRVKLEGFRGAR